MKRTFLTYITFLTFLLPAGLLPQERPVSIFVSFGRSYFSPPNSTQDILTDFFNFQDYFAEFSFVQNNINAGINYKLPVHAKFNLETDVFYSYVKGGSFAISKVILLPIDAYKPIVFTHRLNWSFIAGKELFKKFYVKAGLGSSYIFSSYIKGITFERKVVYERVVMRTNPLGRFNLFYNLRVCKELPNHWELQLIYSRELFGWKYETEYIREHSLFTNTINLRVSAPF